MSYDSRKSDSKIEKIKSFIIEHKKIVFSVCAAALVLSLAAVLLIVISNSEEDFDYMDSGDTKGYDAEEFPLPDDFRELHDMIFNPPGTTDELIETAGAVETVETGSDETPPQTTTRPPREPSPPADTGLPAIHINTESGRSVSSRTTYVAATLSVDSNGTEFSSLDRTGIRIRGRGNSTWRADKKPYRIRFDSSVSIFGLPAGRNYVLLANAYDQSHIRNSVAYAAARTLNFDHVPQAIHVELYINGSYSGLYTIGDSASIALEVEPGGFLLEIGGRRKEIDVMNVDFFHGNVIYHVRVRTPTPRTRLTADQMNYIRDYCREADNAVMALGNYEDYIDMRSLIDYFLFTELLYNLDGAFKRSVFLRKNPGQKLEVASVWDFDLAMGNYSADRSRYNKWASVHNEDTYFNDPSWINFLIEDPVFQYAVRKRWEATGSKMYRAALAEVTRNREFLGPAVARDRRLWPHTKSMYESWSTANIETWSGQLDYIETFLALRKRWIDRQIENFPAEAPGGRDILAVRAPEVITTTPPPETTTAPLTDNITGLPITPEGVGNE